jgi:hypothetical protein
MEGKILNDKNIPVEDNLIPLDFSSGIHLDSNGNIERDKGAVKDCYVCIRPGNKKNVPKVLVEKIGNKIISSNYGHGGIGWSTGWGSVMKAIEFLEEELKSHKNYNHTLLESKIAIIGAGCNGCKTALLLIEKGVSPENIEIFSDDLEWTTSHRSGAILSTASVLEEIRPELKKIYDDINVNSFTTWDDIEKGKRFPKLQKGIQKVKAYFGAEKDYGTIVTDSGLDILCEKGLIPQPELVYVKFKNQLNLMKKYDSFYFNTYKLMKGFYDILFNDFKIKLTRKKLNSFNEIPDEYKLVFNCSGLSNSKDLRQDEDIYPIGGHIVTLRNQEIKKFNYVIYSHYIAKEDIGKYNYSNAPLFYLMLKTDDESFSGLLGGSLMDNYSGGDQKIDEKEYQEILKRTLEIFGENKEDVFKKNQMKPKF